MKMYICPRCQTKNKKGTISCQNCHYTLKEGSSRSKKSLRTFCLWFLFLLFLVAATSSLVYVETKYPDYGLTNRLNVVKQVLLEKDWIESHNTFNDLSVEIEKKKKELTELEQEIEKKKKENELLEKIEDKYLKLENLEKRIENIQEKINEAEKKDIAKRKRREELEY